MEIMGFVITGRYLLNCFHRSSKKDVDLPKQLLGFCVEIADAMEYLSKKGFIHRDLAARNVMLTADTKCKVGICATLVLTMVKSAHRCLIAYSFVSLFALQLVDFGMSHDMDEDYYYKPKGGMIPVKWTAPEAVLYKKYTTKSDVWSYGMVMFEIWSLGHKPFEKFSINQVSNLTFGKSRDCCIFEIEVLKLYTYLIINV